MTFLKRTTALIAAASIAAYSMLPIYPASASDEKEYLPLPTSFSAPSGLHVFDASNGVSDSVLYLTYVAQDYGDFASNIYDNGYWGDKDGNPDEQGSIYYTPYGRGYSAYYDFNIQTDYRIDGGEWHYNESWDTSRFGDYDSFWTGFDGESATYFPNGYVRLFRGSDVTDEENISYEAADCFLEKTDGDSVWYVFDSDNHSVEFRTRVYVEMVKGGYYDNYETDETTIYLHSPWSESVTYGKDAGNSFEVPSSLEAPVLTGLIVGENDYYTGAPDLWFDAKTPFSVLLADNSSYQYNSYMYLDLEISFDGGESWIADWSKSLTGGKYWFSLYDLWNEYTNYEYDTYSFEGGNISVRARYYYDLNDVVNGLEYNYYQVTSPWSEPVTVMVPAQGAYALNITHTGTGYAGDGTNSKSVAEGAEIGAIHCPFVEGCYVESISINGILVYTYTDPDASTAIQWWGDNDFWLTDDIMSQSLDVVITYDGTPTSQYIVNVEYNNLGYIYPEGTGVTDENGIYTGKLPVYAGYDQDFLILADEGCLIDSVLIDGEESKDAIENGVYTFTEISADHSISAVFSRYAWYAVGGCSPNGTIWLEDDEESEYSLVNIGDDITFNFAPNVDEESERPYAVKAIYITCEKDGLLYASLEEYDPEAYAEAVSSGSYTFSNVQSECYIYVEYTTDPVTYYHISTSAGAGGSISESYDVPEGDFAYVVFYPQEGYVIDTVIVDGEVVENFAGDKYIFADVNSDHTISVTFVEEKPSVTYQVSISTESSGDQNAVTPIGEQTISEGGSITITYNPQLGYELSGIRINDKLADISELSGLSGTYTLENITQDTFVVFIFTPVICTVTFEDGAGNVLSVKTCSYGNGIIDPDVNVTKLTTINNDGSYRCFSEWSADFNTVISDMTVIALYSEILFTMTAPSVTSYTIKNGDVSKLNFKVMAFVKSEIRDFYENGDRIITENQYDVTDYCDMNPSILEGAFATGNTADILVIYRGILAPQELEVGRFSITYDEPDFILGDVNEDGIIDAADALFILQYSAEERELTENQLKAADVSGDGEVTPYDSLLILQYSAEMITVFPASVQG